MKMCQMWYRYDPVFPDVARITHSCPHTVNKQKNEEGKPNDVFAPEIAPNQFSDGLNLPLTFQAIAPSTVFNYF